MERNLETQEGRDQFFREITADMAAGSERAFNDFYETCFDRLFRHLLVQTRGREDLAQELTQAVMIRVARYIQPFDNERVFWAWLRQLARSCHVDWLRRNRKHDLALENIESLSVTAEAEEQPDELLLARLDTALGELCSGEREMIRLAYFEAVPHAGMAERLQTSPKAIESKLARIRRKLRTALLEKLKEYALF